MAVMENARPVRDLPAFGGPGVQAGITTVDAANAYIRDVYVPAHNARFAVKAEQEGSAFVSAKGIDLAEILCIQEEHAREARTAGRGQRSGDCRPGRCKGSRPVSSSPKG